LKVRQGVLGGYPLLLRPCSKPRQLVAGLLFIGLGKQLAQISELEAHGHLVYVLIIPPVVRNSRWEHRELQAHFKEIRHTLELL
jgi:hypothetical protein